MAQFRPAGLSDEDSDSDDYGFFEKPVRTHYNPPPPNFKKKLENNLQDAIVHGNTKELEKIVICELKHNVNIKLDSGWTPLIHACFHAQEKIVLYLLEKGADPNLHAESLTPLMAACSNSSASSDTIYNIVQNLIAKGCFLNVGDKYGQTPLMRAIGSGRVEVVKLLIDNKANIEMRDNQGWTAVFWAAHNNQPEVLEMLITQEARLTELDRAGRTPQDIATSHDNDVIVEMLEKSIQGDEDLSEFTKSEYMTPEVRSWHDYYPGINKCEKPDYRGEIPQLLYGMNCENLTAQILNAGLDLRSFLLLDESDMIRLGVDMPYERQRLKSGLRNFHTRGWKLNAVSGLYARNKADSYSVLDCLTSLGSHLHQLYILEATLQYTLREYNKIQNQIKFEPPDSPVLGKMKSAADKILTNVNSIRREVKGMKTALIKISKTNPEPADLIREASMHELVISYVPGVMMVFTLGFLVCRGKTLLNMLFKQ